MRKLTNALRIYFANAQIKMHKFTNEFSIGFFKKVKRPFI